jgi:DNA-binding winged helix-turn-helix (wHTH) protein
MSVLIISASESTFCSLSGVVRSAPRCGDAGDLSYLFESFRPSGVLFVGITRPDPIEWVCRLRRLSTYATPRFAIVGSPDELPMFRNTSGALAEAIPSCLRNLLRPLRTPVATEPRQLVIDCRAREISIGNKRSTCSPTEFRLLLLLLRYPNVTFSRGEILRRVAAREDPASLRLVDVVVTRIRNKIEMRRQTPLHVQTVRGLGYRFTHNEDMFIDRITGQPFLSWPCCL